MAKTEPVGVRFDSELLNKLKELGKANSPQKALNIYEAFFKEKYFGLEPKNKLSSTKEKSDAVETKNIAEPKQMPVIDRKAKIAELKVEIAKLGTDWIGNARRKEIKAEIAKFESEK